MKTRISWFDMVRFVRYHINLSKTFKTFEDNLLGGLVHSSITYCCFLFFWEVSGLRNLEYLTFILCFLYHSFDKFHLFLLFLACHKSSCTDFNFIDHIVLVCDGTSGPGTPWFLPKLGFLICFGMARYFYGSRSKFVH